jgi:hypothetical protein
VLVNIGNYTYTPSGGTNSPYVVAISNSSFPISEIKVMYSRSYSAPAGTPDLTVTPSGGGSGAFTGSGPITNYTDWIWNGIDRHTQGASYTFGPIVATNVIVHGGFDTHLYFTVRAKSDASTSGSIHVVGTAEAYGSRSN